MSDDVQSPARRRLLRDIALLVGATAVSPQIASALMAAGDGEAVSNPYRGLTSSHFQLVETLSEIIIPQTDTAGAIGAGVPQFIDALVASHYPPEHRRRFRRGLEDIDALPMDSATDGFLHATQQQQIALVEKLDRQAFAQESELPGNVFFREFKQLVLFGYYTSEIGATEELRYQPIPGEFKGCVPLREIGRAWATY